LVSGQEELILKSQNGRCALCGSLPTKKDPLVVDHDHSTEKFRAFIHKSCNSMLGFAKDDIELLEKAIAYLRRNQ
jgi:hypothetical protein